MPVTSKARWNCLISEVCYKHDFYLYLYCLCLCFFVKSKSNEHNLIISWTTLVHLYKNIIFKTSSDLLFRDQICCNNTEHTEEENILVIRTHPTTTDRCIKAGSHCGETDHAGRATVMPRNTTALFRTPVRLDESRLFKQQHLRYQHDFCDA